MRRARLLLYFIPVVFVLFSCTASEKAQISKAFVNSKESNKKVFMVTQSGEEITGKKWKLKEHTGSKKIQEMYIDDRVMPLDSLISFQSYYGHAQRLYSFVELGKTDINSSFAYYIKKGTFINLLFREVFVRNETGMVYNPMTKTNEWTRKPIYKYEYFIEKPQREFVKIDKSLLSELSEKNVQTKSIFNKYNKTIETNFKRLIAFVDAYNTN